MANSRQDLETMIRNADAAGDADAVRVLFGELDKLDKEPQQEKEETFSDKSLPMQGLDIVGGGLETIASIPTSILSGLTRGAKQGYGSLVKGLTGDELQKYADTHLLSGLDELMAPQTHTGKAVLDTLGQAYEGAAKTIPAALMDTAAREAAGYDIKYTPEAPDASPTQKLEGYLRGREERLGTQEAIEEKISGPIDVAASILPVKAGIRETKNLACGLKQIRADKLKARADELRAQPKVKQEQVPEQVQLTQLDDILNGKKVRITKEEHKQLRQDFPKKEAAGPLPELEPHAMLPDEPVADISFFDLIKSLEENKDNPIPFDREVPSKKISDPLPTLLDSFDNPLLDELGSSLPEVGQTADPRYAGKTPFEYEPGIHYPNDLHVVPKEWAKTQIADPNKSTGFEVLKPEIRGEQTGAVPEATLPNRKPGGKVPSPKTTAKRQQAAIVRGRKSQRGALEMDEIMAGLREMAAKMKGEPVTERTYMANASGESVASMEALNRLDAENAAGRDMIKVDRYGNVSPLRTADRVDARAMPGEVIMQRGIGADPNGWTIRDAGKDANTARAAAIAKQQQPLGLRRPSEGGFIRLGEKKQKTVADIFKNFEDFAKHYPEESREALRQEWKDAGGTLNTKDVLDGKQDPYAWAGKNVSDNYADVADVVKQSSDIPYVNRIGRNLRQQGAGLKRNLDNYAATWGINVVDNFSKRAAKATETTLTSLDSAINTVRGTLGGKAVRDALISFMKETGEARNKLSEELRSTFDNLYPRLNEAYKKQQELNGRKEIKELGKEEFYAPRTRLGAYRTVILDAEGKPVDYPTASNRGDVKKAIKYYEDQGYKAGRIEYDPTRSYSYYEVDNHVTSPDFIQKMDMSMPEGGTPDATTGFQGHFQERTGSRSWAGNEPWLTEAENAANAHKALVRHIRQAENYIEAVKAQEQLTSMMKDNADKPNLNAELQEYYDMTFKGKKGDKAKAIDDVAEQILRGAGFVLGGHDAGVMRNVGRHLKRTVTMLTLGLANTPTMIAQVIQGPMSSHGEALRYGSSLKTHATSLIEGSVAAALAPMNMALTKAGKKVKAPTAKMKMILDYIEAERIADTFAADVVHSHDAFGAASRMATGVEQGMALSIRLSDQVGRVYAFTSNFNLMKELGYSDTVALDKARDLTDVLMGNAARHNQIRMTRKAGVIGESASQMRSFAANELNNIVYDFKELAKRNPGAAKALVARLGITFAVGGLVAMPLIKDFDDLVYQPLKEQLGKLLKDPTIAYGPGLLESAMVASPEAYNGPLANILGIDLSNVGVSSIVPRSMSESGYALITRTGQIGSGIMDIGRGVVHGEESDVMRGASKVLPSGMPYFQGKLERSMGQELPNGNIVVPEVKSNDKFYIERDKEQQAKRDLGLRDLYESQQRNLSFMQKDRTTRQEQNLKSILEDIPKALTDMKVSGGTSMKLQRIVNKYVAMGGTAPELMNAIQRAGFTQAQSQNIALRYMNIKEKNPRRLLENVDRLTQFEKLK